MRCLASNRKYPELSLWTPAPRPRRSHPGQARIRWEPESVRSPIEQTQLKKKFSKNNSFLLILPKQYRAKLARLTTRTLLKGDEYYGANPGTDLLASRGFYRE